MNPRKRRLMLAERKARREQLSEVKEVVVEPICEKCGKEECICCSKCKEIICKCCKKCGNPICICCVECKEPVCVCKEVIMESEELEKEPIFIPKKKGKH
ncbi:MAG: hypothetical protein Q8P81_03445 [Nanoarchaeota archaeon]|nr:hypothetical protein [Nanoarchaeota archaeon]